VPTPLDCAAAGSPPAGFLSSGIAPTGDILTDDLQHSLESAIAPGLTLERELGGGGMSRVFLAREAGLDRQVVVKVLAPHLAAGVSAERFRREIQVAARLQHPHIVPLLTAGQAGDVLFYTMPFVEGESLRARLGREGELPVALAVRLLQEVARALAYAHRQGIVHRDIKPANILLAEDEAQVADFGIAKALASSASASESDGLTSVGLALGTPAYMSPEQAGGDAVDHRADLYALGCVGYEMLTGQPPFERRTPQAMMAAHATEAPVPVATRRPAVPSNLAALVMRLMEKRPADRPQDADEVVRALNAVTHPEQVAAEARTRVVATPSAAPAHRGRWLVAGAAGAVMLAVVAAAVLKRHPPPIGVDAQLVAVAPFRVTGADSGVSYLREGMVDLLSATMSGTSDFRTADPRAVVNAWRRAEKSRPELSESEAISEAARVGAGRLVLGEAVGTRSHVTLNAALLEVPGGKTRVRASVEGSLDSLPRLVDRLAAELLALGAGEDQQRLAGLISTSLPALRAYLDGQSLLRRGQFAPARERFEQAIQLDSTFALAGLAYAAANEWLGGRNINPGSQVAWRERQRLPSVERLRLETHIGPHYPSFSTVREYIGAAERFAAAAPDRPEAWYKLGDLLYHEGPLVGIADAHPRARRAFARALAIDPTFAPALEHAPQLAFELADTAGVKNALRDFLRVDSTSPMASYHRWYVAAGVGDSATARAALGDPRLRAYWFSSTAISQGIGTRETGELARRAMGEAVTAEERAEVAHVLWANLLAVGRPREAQANLENQPAPRRTWLTLVAGLFADGDSVATEAASRSLRREVGAPVAALPDGVWGRYAVGQYAVNRGDLVTARRAVADLNAARAPGGNAWMVGVATRLALVLQAQVAAREQSVDAGPLLDELDSMLVQGSWVAGVPGNLVAARLHEQRGDLAAALAAVRRREFDLEDFPPYVTYAREEGRLAALTGDRAGAIKAYRRYLALRINPEPSLRPQVAQVRADLEALEREPTDR
jgi:eukaryotic-like serine/threonine-protein kinase